jgi:hypothetical protein
MCLRIEQRLQIATAPTQQNDDIGHGLLLTNIAPEMFAFEADLIGSGVGAFPSLLQR